MENARNIKRYEDYLKNEEKADATIRKYLHEVEQLLAYMDKAEISKAAILQYRRYLSSQYKAGTVNGKLSAIHSYLEFMNLDMCKVKFLKVQKKAYIDEERELTEQDYRRLLDSAGRMGKSQLYYLMMVLYSTGIRISELPYVTVEAVCQGKTEIYMKGKCRLIIFPKNLIKKLKELIRNEKIKSGRHRKIPSFVCRRFFYPISFKISSFSGMDRIAPFFVVISEAPAFAKVSSSPSFPSSRLSSPCSST